MEHDPEREKLTKFPSLDWTLWDAFNTVGFATGITTSENPEVNAVADHIRALGYTVVCGNDIDYINGNKRWPKKSYVIIAIKNKEGEYVYGGPEPPTEWEENPSPSQGWATAFTCKWSDSELTEMWPLLRLNGLRLKLGLNTHSQPQDPRDPFMIRLALSGELRTIGNTFPPDIVLALKEYDGSHKLYSWEFLMPEQTACPCAEAVEEQDVTRSSGGFYPPGTAVAEAAAAAVATVGPNKEDSDSSSEED
tara:strand:+ start:1831 stop:2580 length:750 start_codon:yes stop_codon:yes gene_type:complete